MSKPIKCGFFEPDLINAAGFSFACKGTQIIAAIVDAVCFDANVDTWKPALQKETR